MIKQSYNVPFDDAKKIVAYAFGVEPKDVIKTQYSFSVIGGTMPEFLAKEEPEQND